MHIAYFGHDIHDAAIRKRVRALAAAGHEVTGFMMRRGPLIETEWDNIDLGRTHDGAYLQRLSGIWKGAGLAFEEEDLLRQADVVIARNLDMLICASIACTRASVSVPLIYECLDIHHMLTRPGPAGAVLRRIERSLLNRTSLLVLSSPAFERDYFRVYHPGSYTPWYLENRLSGRALPPRRAAPRDRQGPLRIGWFGILRCERSLGLLAALARNMDGQVEIVTAGKPAVIEGFEKTVEAAPFMSYGGPYTAPEDLPALYGAVDLVWAGDFYQADFNSRALLPNRLYEGGYFGVPAIAPAGTQTAEWLSRHGTGFVLEEPLEETLPALAQNLLADPARLTASAAHVLSLPRDIFVEPEGFMDEMLAAALSAAPARKVA